MLRDKILSLFLELALNHVGFPSDVTSDWFMAAQPGLEPGKRDPESRVLPITPPGNICSGLELYQPHP